MDDERHVVESARAGDPDAWELLYRRAYPRLIAFARRRLASSEQAEEAVSETMVRAMDRIGHYRSGPAGIHPWLFGIARNVVLETYRAGGRHRQPDPGALTEATDSDPESLVLRSEEHRLLADAFCRLSASDQDVLELRVIAGLGAEQVAELTGRAAGAVRTAQSRALARLRTELEGLMA
jgi:RNA polymerase sigma-70 factor (ECF subfamily)